MDNGAWQKNNVFTGLTPNSSHSFYQRIAETDTNYVSDSSAALSVTTDKSKANPPKVPTLSAKTKNSVALTGVIGYEYSKDGIHWQDSPTFTGLQADTEYYFYQRVKETDTHYASSSSAALVVKTNAEYIVGDLNEDDSITDADAIYLLMQTFFPGDYPVEQDCDFNGDGAVTDADAIYLLMYTFFPSDYPIEKGA